MHTDNPSRRSFLAGGLAFASSTAWAQAFKFEPQQRYPDPSVQALDPEFARYRIYDSSVEQIARSTSTVQGLLLKSK